MSNYLALCQKFQEKSGITGSEIASVLNQTGMNKRIIGWIADAEENVRNLWQDWKFNEGEKVITTIIGTDEYTLAALGITDHVSWDKDRFYINPETDSYRKLNYVTYQEWLDSGDRLGVKVNEEPNKIVIKPNNSLVLIGVPDDAYTIWARYFLISTRLAANADTSPIPTEYELVIIHRAKMYYAEYYENPDLYSTADKDYLAELVKLEAAQLPEQETRTRAANNPEDNVIVVE